MAQHPKDQLAKKDRLAAATYLTLDRWNKTVNSPLKAMMYGLPLRKNGRWSTLKGEAPAQHNANGKALSHHNTNHVMLPSTAEKSAPRR